MNNCDMEAVDALFRGELEPAEAARVSEHVAVCPECTAELRWLERERLFFQARKDAYPAPPSLAEVLAATRTPSRPRPIAQSKKTAPGRSRWMFLGFGLAAAFLIGAVLLLSDPLPSPNVAADPRPPNSTEPHASSSDECFACAPASDPKPPEPDSGPESEDCELNTSSGVTFPVCGPQKK